MFCKKWSDAPNTNYASIFKRYDNVTKSVDLMLASTNRSDNVRLIDSMGQTTWVFVVMMGWGVVSNYNDSH